MNDFWIAKNSKKMSKFFLLKVGLFATVAPHDQDGWNFQKTQFLNRGVICQNFQEASLKTVDLPPDVLFEFKNLKNFSKFSFYKFFYLPRLHHMATCWNFLETHFLNRRVICRRGSLKTMDSPPDVLFELKKKQIFLNFSFYKFVYLPRWHHMA